MRRVLILATIVMLVMSTPIMASPFPDLEEDHWAYDAVNILYAAGLLRGYPDGELKIRQDMTRAEAIRLVADTFQYLNDRIDSLKAQDTGGDLESAGYLRTIVQEALTEKLGEQVDPAVVDELIAAVAEINAKFELEKEVIDARFVALEQELAEYKESVEQLKAAYKADLEKIKSEYISELNSIKSSMANLESNVGLIGSGIDEVKSDIANINKRLDKFTVSGSSEFLVRSVSAEGVDLDNDNLEGTVFEGLSTREAFRHELTLNLGIKPDDNVSIDVGMKLLSDLDRLTENGPFDLESLEVLVEAPDFTGVFGPVGPVTISELTLKDWEAEGFRLTGKSGILDGAQVLALEEPGKTGQYLVGVSGSRQFSDNVTVGAAFAQVIDAVADNAANKVIAAFGEAKVLDGEWTITGEVATTGEQPTGDHSAGRLNVKGTIAGVNASLTYTNVGAQYQPLALAGKKAELNLTPDTQVSRVDLSMPIQFFEGLTAKAAFELKKGAVESKTASVGAHYFALLSDMDGSLEIDVNRRVVGDPGVTTGFVKATMKDIVQNSVLELGYVLEESDKKSSIAFDWNMFENMDLAASVVMGADKTESKLGLDYRFALGRFNANVGMEQKITKVGLAADTTKDRILNFGLNRQITPSTGLNVGFKSLMSTSPTGDVATAQIASATLDVQF